MAGSYIKVMITSVVVVVSLLVGVSNVRSLSQSCN